jgi:hypothetical protein
MARQRANKKQAPQTTAQRLRSVIKSARDIMRKDKGLSGDLDRLPALTWVMFLKFLDDMERNRELEAELAGVPFKPLIEPPYRWRDWAADEKAISGDDLIAFINNDEAVRPDGKRGPGLFAYLRGLDSTDDDPRRQVVATVFRGTLNRMINGYLLRDVVNKVDEIRFDSAEEIHTLRSVPKTIRDNEVLREMAVVITFSQQAKDKLVGPMIDRGDLDRAFCGFDVNTVAQLDPAQVVRDHWHNLSVIRYKKKIKAIVGCAQKLIETRRYYGSFAHMIGSIDIPARLNTLADVDLFWTKFSLLQSKMREAQFPYFQRTTSLLHLLLDFGFPCVKPDSVVLQVARDIGIEGDIISVVTQIQRYSVSRNTPPAVMDFYFLAYGGQTWAEQFLERPLSARVNWYDYSDESGPD